MSEQISVKVKQIRYQKEDGDWKIIVTDKGSCLGCIPWEPKEGEPLRLFGRWEKSSYNGQPEFKFTSAIADIPTDPRALLDYACTITNGIGPKKADEIWSKYGESWQEDSKNLDIPGLRESTKLAWTETLETLMLEQEKADTIAFLMGKSITSNVANKAWDVWKESAVGVVSANPYQLMELTGVGFVVVDNDVAPHFGIGKDDPRRHKAACLFVVEKITKDGGHTCIQMEDLSTEFNRIIGMHGQADVADIVELLITDEKLVRLNSNLIAESRVFTHEARIINFITEEEL